MSSISLCNNDACIVATADTGGDLLASDQHRHFLISWGGGHIAVGLVGQEAFLTYDHSADPYPVLYAGIASRNGPDGEWIYCGSGKMVYILKPRVCAIILWSGCIENGIGALV